MPETKKKVQKTTGYAHLKELRDYYLEDPASIRLLDEKEEELRAAIDASGIRDFPEVKKMVKEITEIVEAINTLLLNDKDLTEKGRAQLLGERDAHDFYLERFSAERSEAKKVAVEKYLAREVEKIRTKRLSTG